MPYELDEYFRENQKDRALIEQALKEWQVIKFKLKWVSKIVDLLRLILLRAGTGIHL